MAYISFGASVSVDDGSSASQQDIPEVKSITVPASERGSVDVSHLGLSDDYKLYIPTLIDPGVLEVECYWTAELVTRLNLINGITHNWVVTGPETGGSQQTFTFDGFVTKVETTMPGPEEPAMTKFSVKVSGGITLG